MGEGQRLSELSEAIRESTLKRLHRVPEGLEDWRPVQGGMSFADLAAHLAEADRWFFQKLEAPALPPITGATGGLRRSRIEYDGILAELERLGRRRSELLAGMGESDLTASLRDDRFGGVVTVWWLIVRGNLDHETHHRGQLATYLRMVEKPGGARGASPGEQVVP